MITYVKTLAYHNIGLNGQNASFLRVFVILLGPSSCSLPIGLYTSLGNLMFYNNAKQIRPELDICRIGLYKFAIRPMLYLYCNLVRAAVACIRRSCSATR